ncbi:MAG: glycosyltransferase [Verrucomicrobia bacterium]|nr:glycosyltransferase [Verrucomicrobiota bacterium]MBI3870627.1 glycosyltransferase [Verrucomicrobiota bacterium]
MAVKIFFQGGVGGDWMSGWQRRETLRDLGHDVASLCHDAAMRSAHPSRWRLLLRKPEWNQKEAEEFNQLWFARLIAASPDLAWLEWPKLLSSETLQAARRKFPRCLFVGFYDDNPFGGRTQDAWQWRRFLDAAPQYDLLLVKRATDVERLRAIGARRAELFMHGYFEKLFRPRGGEDAHQHDVSFVGTALDHRVGFVRQLIGREELPVRVFGNRWERTLVYHRHRSHFAPPVLGEAYAEVLQTSRVNLGFVSSSNQDEYTMRSFEIPACRGFMLAERTPAHQALFEEGREAEFFSSVEECADKARFYLDHPEARRRIAQGGYERSTQCDYSLRRRLRDVLQALPGRAA